MANGANIGLGFLEAFQQARKGVLDRQQQAEENELTRQLRQIQIAQAQQSASEAPLRRAILEEQLRKSLMTPEQIAIENARSANIQQLASQPGVVFQQGGPIEEVTPEAQQILGMRQTAAELGAVPFTREGIPGIQMQTAIPGLPGVVRSPAEISRLQDQARINAALKRELEGPKFEQVGNTLLRLPATGSPEVVFTAPQKSDFKYEFVKNVENPKDVRYLPINPETGTPPEGFTFVKAGESGMKPSEVISAQREVRTVYDDIPAKIDYFGKGQVPGSNQLKTRLDAVLKPVNNDFSKLTGTAADTFVFALNKLRDPTSATLLAEASQIAARAGISDRFGAYIENIKSGNQVSTQVAKDIYDVISQVHSVHRENLIRDLIPIAGDLEGLGKKLTAIGVPADIQKEVEARIASGQEEAVVPRGTNQTEMIPIIDPQGRAGMIPSQNLQRALQQGYTQSP